MALDVKVYNNLKIVELDENDDDFHYDFQAMNIEEIWFDRIKNLEIGKFYEGDAIAHLISYAYGTHNRFREQLLRLIAREDLLLPEDGKIAWDKLYPLKHLPFYEILYFADNEGVLDWETSEKLYNDFKAHEFLAKKFFEQDVKRLEYFYDWMETFELAKDNGVVVFK